MAKLVSKNKKLIIANWKMNPDSLRDARKIFADLKKKNLKNKKSTAVICPPISFLADLSLSYRGSAFRFGAQDVSYVKKTECTGEISTSMLKELKAELVIVGHSERRAIGDTDEIVAAKLKRVLDTGLTPVLCVGETKRDEDGEYLTFIKEQLQLSLKKVPKKEAHKVVIAYEPVWTIGKGHKAMTGTDIHHMTIFIRKHLSKIYGHKVALEVPVLYGGSVDEDNTEEIINIGHVDGLLVGRASLNPHVFADILRVVG